MLDRLQSTGNGNNQDIIADIDVASSLATPEADVHFEIGRLYAGVGAQERAMAAFDQWLELHRDDSRAADALAYSCRARALLARELPRALSDCNRAVQDRPGVPFPLENRGIVHVRLRNFEKAIADLDKVVAAQPMNPWALYIRGLAKIGAGRNKEGEADIAAAKGRRSPRGIECHIARACALTEAAVEPAQSSSDQPRQFICAKWGSKYPATESESSLSGIATREQRTIHAALPDRRSRWHPAGSAGAAYPGPAVIGNEVMNRGWRKLSLFSPAMRSLISGPVLYLDLDVILLQPLDACFLPDTPFAVIKDYKRFRWRNFRTGNTSVFLYQADRDYGVYDRLIELGESVRRRFRNEQGVPD